MPTITIDVPNSLAERLFPYRERVPEILVRFPGEPHDKIRGNRHVRDGINIEVLRQ